MIPRFDSYTLFYPQNQAFIRGESPLPEGLMIVDGIYRAFQMPILFVIGIIFIPFALAQGLIQLAKVVNIRNLPQVAMLIQFAGFGVSGLAVLNLLSIFSNPVLFKWMERLWAKHRASKIIQNGGEVIDGWVFSVKEDSDKDWCIEFKTSQESTANLYSIKIPYLPDHLSHLENGSALKFLRNNNCLFML
ncbi:hypothetical protein H6F42_19640 [Pseudanabaena sp. FACHB-1998]|uniref:hypothetical protein n=1 Tax=Pseudanabaena sp. FACHB-1998 TaxID=2692858 RepID=UPI0016819B85|nr:hypothetical protein [Pseudanabaena sp. FACHB-1998]MBD2179141.1 hypothetical protein [Pseudanabaena sp. FACHB-1998]